MFCARCKLSLKSTKGNLQEPTHFLSIVSKCFDFFIRDPFHSCELNFDQIAFIGLEMKTAKEFRQSGLGPRHNLLVSPPTDQMVNYIVF